MLHVNFRSLIIWIEDYNNYVSNLVSKCLKSCRWKVNVYIIPFEVILIFRWIPKISRLKKLAFFHFASLIVQSDTRSESLSRIFLILKPGLWHVHTLRVASQARMTFTRNVRRYSRAVIKSRSIKLALISHYRQAYKMNSHSPFCISYRPTLRLFSYSDRI